MKCFQRRIVMSKNVRLETGKERVNGRKLEVNEEAMGVTLIDAMSIELPRFEN